MLRPIDTQTIYQQSQEVSNRQQQALQGTERQQVQFASLFQKETEEKQDAVNEVKEQEHLRSDLKQREGQRQPQERQKYKKKNKKEKKKQEGENIGHIDIRV